MCRARDESVVIPSGAGEPVLDSRERDGGAGWDVSRQEVIFRQDHSRLARERSRPRARSSSRKRKTGLADI